MTTENTAQDEGPSARDQASEAVAAEIVFDSVTKRYPGQERPAVDHLSFTIGDNIATVPRLLGWDKHRVNARVEELLDLIDLPQEMRKRYPAQLSGGQRQRVGVARALAADPPLMLMDEPFGAIDPITRERLQNEFLRLQAVVKKTIVFVTHDIDEAIKMGHRIAILREGGRLAQFGTPEEILSNPADEFVARFVGADRGLKRLALRQLDEIELRPVPTDGRKRLECPADTTVADALSAMLTAGTSDLVVRGADGELTGYLTFDVVSRLLSTQEDEVRA